MPKKTNKPFVAFIVVFSIIALLGVAAGVYLIDSPATARLRNFDQAKTRDLRNIMNNIDDYYRDNNELPEKLSEIEDYHQYRLVDIEDPQTDEPYEYNIVNAETGKYELCADFNLASEETERRGYFYREFEHTEGRNCFEFEAGEAR